MAEKEINMETSICMKNPGIIIREFTKADATEVIGVLQRNIPAYFDASEEADFIVYLNQELERYFVAIANSTIVGAGGINFFRHEKTARLSWDFVHPDFHGMGIGRKLAQHRIELIRQDISVETIVVRTTQLVYPFYQKMGFMLQKIQKDYWAKGFDLYHMAMPAKATG